MLKNLMEDKRLDFDAPLLSVRRFAPPEPAPRSEKTDPDPNRDPNPSAVTRRRSSLPFYKSDLKSGPVRNPGVVPFLWERTPGQPKDRPAGGPGRPPVAPRLPPGRISNEKEPAAPSASVRTKRPVSFSSDVEKPLPEPEPEPEQEKEKAEESRPIPAERPDQEDEDEDEDEDDDDAYSDALDTLSRAESFFMNCSVSGLSGIPDAKEPSGSFSTDPQVRDFMMGRFLPAARAVATSSPQCAPRKPSREPVPTRLAADSGSTHQQRQRIPLGYRYRADDFVHREEVESFEDEDEDEEYYGNGHLPSKGCGFLPRFCLKSNFCLLNPVPGMKVRSRLPPPTGRRIRAPPHYGSLGQAEEEHSWEAVYRHKLGHTIQSHVEEGSKLTSQSNRLTNRSDSPTPPDGSSPYHRSMGGAISPYRNEPSQSPFHEGKGFLGVPKTDSKEEARTDGSDSLERDGERYWVITPRDGSQQGSGSVSPAVDRILYVDSVTVSRSSNSKSSSGETTADIKGAVTSSGEDYEDEMQSRIMEESIGLKTCDRIPLQDKVSEVIEPGSMNFSGISACGGMDKENGFKCNDRNAGPLPSKEDILKNDVNPLNSLLPPPLPQSPSESWLHRTLPSVSSKNQSAQSFLGIKFQPKKQASAASPSEWKQESNVKPPKVQHRQIRFADVLATPLSPKSEI